MAAVLAETNQGGDRIDAVESPVKDLTACFFRGFRDEREACIFRRWRLHLSLARWYDPVMWHSIPLTLFWFVYFGSLGIFFPYFALYLRENAGLSGTEVGLILAISPLVGMIAQPVWGQLADRTGARTRTLAFLTIGTAAGYIGLGRAAGFWPIVMATALLALAGTAVFPMMTSVSLAILRDAGRHAFGHVRAWGTVGYLILLFWFTRVQQKFNAPHE